MKCRKQEVDSVYRSKVITTKDFYIIFGSQHFVVNCLVSFFLSESIAICVKEDELSLRMTIVH